MISVQSIGIVGHGQFGRFVERLARERFPSIDVRIASRGDEASLASACAADFVFLCVPIAAYTETAVRIAPLVGERTVVIDVATVKGHSVHALREAGIKRFIATHPMFGPFSYEKHGRSLKGLRIAVCDSTLSADEYAAIITFLKNAELRVLEMSADAHDRLIAETLFLTHLVGQTIRRGGFERTSIDTVSFGYLMDAVESVAADSALFQDVFKYNPYCKEVLARFVRAQDAAIDAVTEGNTKEALG